jgi:hypothetical protein
VNVSDSVPGVRGSAQSKEREALFDQGPSDQTTADLILEEAGVSGLNGKNVL